MATRLYGTLRDGLGKPIVNATVALLAKGNSLLVLSGSEAIFKTDSQGSYNITVQTGYYKVIIGPQGGEPYKAGEIAIYADSLEGSLNSYLVNWAEEDLTPEVIKQFKELVAVSEQYSLQAGRSAAAAQADATDARNSKASAAQSASDALVYKNDSKTNADAAKQAQAGAAGSANTAGAALTTIQGIQKDVTASKDRAVTAETNAKSSENVATQAKTEAVTAKDQAVAAKDKAQQIADSIDPQLIKNSIGLGAERRYLSNLTTNFSDVGFYMINSNTVGYPSVADQSTMSGYITRQDGTPAYTGLFVDPGHGHAYTMTQFNNVATFRQLTFSADVDRIKQLSSGTRVYGGPQDERYFEIGTGAWGVYNVTEKKWLPLAISQGGTGAVTIKDAKTNLQIPEGGLTNIITINAPSGTEDGKYYPVIIYTGNMNGNGNMLCPVDIVTKSAGASDPMNNNTFFGHIRCGGWSDMKDVAFGHFVAYDPKEVGILCVKGSKKDYANYVAFYIHNRAFPIRIQVGYKANVIVPTEDYVLGSNGVRFKFGVTSSTDGDVENNVGNILDFEGGGSGFYSNAPFRRGYSTSFALTNNLTTGDNFLATIPNFIIDGRIQATQGFIAYSDSTEGRSFITRRTNAEKNITLDQTELWAGDGNGQIVVRDMSSAAKHQFFNFNLNGTFSPPNGLLTSTGADWNSQINTENKFYGIAGSDNAPETAVYGGVHVGFSGSYSFQICGRNGKFFARTFEEGSPTTWERIIVEGLYGIGIQSMLLPEGGQAGFYSDHRGDTQWAPSNGAGFQSSYDPYRIFQLWMTTSGGAYVRFNNTGNAQASKTDNTWTTLQTAGTSDINFKRVHGEMDTDVALDNISKLEFVYFNYLSDGQEREIRRGIIAQQAQEVDPEYVHSAETSGKMTLDSNPLLLDALAAIQSLKKKDQDNKDRISKLETEVEELKTLVATLVNKEQPLP